MPPAGFQCKQCGYCCREISGAFQTCASEADIRRWQEADRDDILAWVVSMALGDQFVHDLWIDPETGEDATGCPWLQKMPGQNRYICRIQDLKPDHCRNYPHSRQHAEETGCPGFGPEPGAMKLSGL